MNTTVQFRRRLTFSIRSWFLFVVVAAIGLMIWRGYQRADLRPMIAARDAALKSWRQIHARCQIPDSGITLGDEYVARQQYFLLRDEVESANQLSWWNRATGQANQEALTMVPASGDSSPGRIPPLEPAKINRWNQAQ